MKQKITISIILLATVIVARAQAPYTVTVSGSAYTNLSGGTQLVYSAPPDDGYYATGNFDFNFFARKSSFKQVTTPKNSNGGFLASAGYLALYEFPNLDNTIGVQCMYIDSFRTVPGITTAWSKLEGTAGNRIMKVEWRDVVYGTNTASRANFQIWLHEADGSISYHYGSNSIPNASSIGTYCGVIVFNPTFTGLVSQFSLSGAVASPQTTYGGTSLGLPKLNSIPANGTVFTLKHNATAIQGLHEMNKIKVYPNPAGDYMMVNAGKASQVYIYNASGQFIQSLKNSGKELKIDISPFVPGTYIVKAEGMVPQQFVVK